TSLAGGGRHILGQAPATCRPCRLRVAALAHARLVPRIWCGARQASSPESVAPPGVSRRDGVVEPDAISPPGLSRRADDLGTRRRRRSGKGGPAWLPVGENQPSPACASLRASSRAAGREPVGGNELLGSLANLLFDLADAISREVSGPGCLIHLVVGHRDDGVHDII